MTIDHSNAILQCPQRQASKGKPKVTRAHDCLLADAAGRRYPKAGHVRDLDLARGHLQRRHELAEHIPEREERAVGRDDLQADHVRPDVHQQTRCGMVNRGAVRGGAAEMEALPDVELHGRSARIDHRVEVGHAAAPHGLLRALRRSHQSICEGNSGVSA